MVQKSSKHMLVILLKTAKIKAAVFQSEDWRRRPHTEDVFQVVLCVFCMSAGRDFLAALMSSNTLRGGSTDQTVTETYMWNDFY